jgi:hypothetical protein
MILEAEFPIFYFIAIAAYLYIKYKSKSKEEKGSNKSPKKGSAFDEILKKIEQEAKKQKPLTPVHPHSKPVIPNKPDARNREMHAPTMAAEPHSDPMHQTVYKGKTLLSSDIGTLELSESEESATESLTDKINRGVYHIEDVNVKNSKSFVKLNKKEYTGKELIIIQTIFEKKYFS